MGERPRSECSRQLAARPRRVQCLLMPNDISVSLNFAFVFVLGQFFLWIPLACFGSYLLGRWCLKRERDLWAQR